jgi:hypothetical protein
LALTLLGAYFVRQSWRARRGFFWVGTIRPFLLTLVIATILICLLPIPLGLEMKSDEMLVATVVGSFALGLGVSLSILRGPLVAHPRRKEAPP